MLREKDILQRVLARALAKGGEFAEIFVEDRVSTSLRAEDGKIERALSGFTRGAGIRVIAGESTGYAFTDNWEDEALLAAAETARSVVRSSSEMRVVSLEERKPTVSHLVEERPESIAKSEKAEMVERADEAARNRGKEIRQVTVAYGDAVQKVLIANSQGVLAEDERVYTRLVVQAVAARNGIVQTGAEGPGRLGGFEFFRENRPEVAGQIAADRALTMLAAKAAPTGRMPVILHAGFGGVLFHEACGHGLEADLVQKKASVYAHRLGDRVAAETVTALDDSTILNAWGSFSFDDEGTPAERTVVIEEGRLVSYLHSWLTARRGRAGLTANGRRQSYRHVPIPRMTNTFIAPGKSTLEEMLEGVELGLYAKALGGGQVDTATGDFVFGVSEGYLVQKGRITHPVRGATLIGNGPRTLEMIDLVGSNLEFEPGTCGKEDQASPVGTGQATLRIRELTVGGTEV
jgi:TldD protein